MNRIINSTVPNSVGLLGAHATKTNGQKVTVVIRTKNRPVVLARALASVLSQTHEDWHLYVVNDGGERKPIDDLISIYSTALRGRITVIHHEHSMGMETASNAALMPSQSDFIVIHDDDDSWHPEFLEETTKFLLAPENDRYVAVVTYCTLVYERIVDNGIVEEYRTDWSDNHRFIEFGKVLQQNSFPPIALLVRRSVANKLGYFNESLPVLGGWDFNIRLMSIGDIGVIPQHLAYYHHRKSAGDSTYGNSVISGLSTHELYNVLYQNSLLRESLRNGISSLGPLSLTLRAVAEMRQKICQDLTELRQSLEQTNIAASWICEALRPVRWIWHQILPFRRCVVKLRGQI
jgi:glycosyltransferase involved in cell wall biosynthesis